MAPRIRRAIPFMDVPVFVDTNVLVYARDASESTKQPQAMSWMGYLWASREGRLSFQVLHEYYVTVTSKLQPGMNPVQARADVASLLAWRPHSPDAHALEAAWDAQDRYSLSFWDALIVAAARATGSATLLTEDLQDGTNLLGVRVVDPFLHDPPARDGP